MKYAKPLLLIPAVLLLTTICHAQETNKQKFKKLEWLVGKWTRTNAKPGESGYETWAKISDTKLSGKGVTLKGKEIHFVEELEFSIKGNNIFYIVKVTGEKKPTYFQLTAISDKSFTCENPKHDFPKKITYQQNGKNIKATISGDGQSIDYTFVPAKL